MVTNDPPNMGIISLNYLFILTENSNERWMHFTLLYESFAGQSCSVIKQNDVTSVLHDISEIVSGFESICSEDSPFAFLNLIICVII